MADVGQNHLIWSKKKKKKPQLCEVFMDLRLSALDYRNINNQKYLTLHLMSFKKFIVLEIHLSGYHL